MLYLFVCIEVYGPNKFSDMLGLSHYFLGINTVLWRVNVSFSGRQGHSTVPLWVTLVYGGFIYKHSKKLSCMFSDYTGPTCETKVNRCDPDPCQNSGSCHDNGHQFVCTCPSGYHGYWCEESDNICESLNPCKNGATCVNTGSQPVCQCAVGYIGIYCEKGWFLPYDIVAFTLVAFTFEKLHTQINVRVQ